MRSTRRRPSLLLAALLAALLIPQAASGQYFGRNKVQYRQFQFQVLQTEHFDVYFYPRERQGAELAARLAERWNSRLERLFDHRLKGRQPLVLYASHPDFEQTNIIQGELGEGTGGVTEPLRRRIILPLGGPLADTDHVIGHELVHAFQYDIVNRRGSDNAARGGLERLPLWFVEGMAEYFSLGPVDPNTAMWVRDAVRAEKLPTVRDLDDSRYFPYRWGQAFWAYVGGRWGDAVIPRLLQEAGASGDVGGALKSVLGMDDKELSKEWQAATRAAYETLVASAPSRSETGRIVIQASDKAGRINVGPAISPDGRWLAFLSERTLFSIELFVADAATGQVVRKLTSTATSPHYSSLQFIYSAGAWDAASRRLAVSTVAGGRATLSIFDVTGGERDREIRIDDVDEIFNPTWAPDGHAICFTGLAGGLTDLYVYDLARSKLRRLTNDAYADLQPAWSPDGRRIAFATDRFTTRLETLATGPYRLALAEPETGAISEVEAFRTGKHLDPQWTADGSALYFVSDRDGIPNVYVVTIATGEVAQITRVATGVSGITESSPALSVAAARDLAAFSVYEDGKYDIYALNLAGREGPLSAEVAGATVLPPLDRKASDVAALLEDASTGLPPPTSYPVSEYKKRMTLESVAQPVVAIGADRFGPAIGGGLSFVFGDMLNDHLLAAAVQFNSGVTGSMSFKDTAAQLAYVNQSRRWNWGVIGGQVPYVSGAFQTAIGAYRGQPAELDQTIIYRQTERAASGLTTYPFDRSRRIELQGGVTQISFDQTVRTDIYSLLTGDRLFSDHVTTSLADPLTLGTASGAFVSDTSSFGATSPVRGERFRLEAAPSFGTINFANLLADYRHYFMPVPFYTVAVRGLHYGRYGSGSEDVRLYPLYLGYPSLVRGYDVNSFDSSECVPNATSSCPSFDRLFGSRLLVGNIELRVPLLRPFGVSQRMYGPVPVEIAAFLDGAVAWNKGERPFTGSRDGIASAGLTVRVNLMGFAVGQFDIARPFQRPGKGWVFQFSLTPGF